MTTFAIASSIPFGSTIVMPVVGSVLGWSLIAVLAMSVAAVAAIANARTFKEERGSRNAGALGFGTPLAHRGAA